MTNAIATLAPTPTLASVLAEGSTSSSQGMTIDGEVAGYDTYIGRNEATDYALRTTDGTREVKLSGNNYAIETAGGPSYLDGLHVPVVAVTTNSDYSVQYTDVGKTFVYDYAGDILFNLPTGTVATVGMKFSFVNATTNLLKLNAATGQSIDDSANDQEYELYSGQGGVNAWPWSSTTLVLERTNWWHVTYARGTWTTTGTNSPVATPPPQVRGIGGAATATPGASSTVVSYGATYPVDMYPTLTIGTNATSVSVPEVVSWTRSNFTFQVRTSAGIDTNGLHILWNACPAP
jgi:hypothetical protein